MIVTLTNLLNPNEFTFNGASVTDGVINYTANVFGMVMQTMPDAIANHIYYGRCYQKTEPGYTQADGRFEMMKDDNYQNCFTFGTFFDTNGEWVRISDCVSRDAPEAEAYNLRSFTVNPTTNAYRKELIIIDLTAAFGAGNEPTKDWCDANIPYFVGQKTILVGGGIIPMKYALRRRMMAQGKGSGPWTVTVDGEWGLWYWKERLSGNNIIVNGVSLFANYTSTDSKYPVRTVSQQYTVNNGDIITLIIGIEDSAYITSAAGIWIDDVKVVSPSAIQSYTYEMVVNSDCRITGVIPSRSNQGSGVMPDNGAIKVYTEV